MINLPRDRYYRGYRLSLNEETGSVTIYHGPDRIDTVTNETKGMSRTTTDAAKDIVDGYMLADDGR